MEHLSIRAKRAHDEIGTTNRCWFFPDVETSEEPFDKILVQERTSRILHMNIPEENRDILEEIALSYVDSEYAQLAGLAKDIIYTMDYTQLKFFTAICMNMATNRNFEI